MGKDLIDIEPTEAQRQEVLDDLLARNAVRKKAQLPQVDVDEAMAEELQKIRMDNYLTELSPIVREVLDGYPPATNGIHAFAQDNQARKEAAQILYDRTGLEPPGPIGISFMKLLTGGSSPHRS